MRIVILSIALLTLAGAGFYTVSASIAASRDGKAATFSERFDAAPVYKGPLDRQLLLAHHSGEQR